MIQTSNFWHFASATFNHCTNAPDPRLVSIALRAPEWYRGRSYPALAPRADMLKMDELTYRAEYEKILDNLDPQKVAEDLGRDAILLCWEPPGKFCHRRLVAEWLEGALGVTVPELPGNYNPRQKDLFPEGG